MAQASSFCNLYCISTNIEGLNAASCEYMQFFAWLAKRTNRPMSARKKPLKAGRRQSLVLAWENTMKYAWKEESEEHGQCADYSVTWYWSYRSDKLLLASALAGFYKPFSTNHPRKQGLAGDERWNRTSPELRFEERQVQVQYIISSHIKIIKNKSLGNWKAAIIIQILKETVWSQTLENSMGNSSHKYKCTIHINTHCNQPIQNKHVRTLSAELRNPLRNSRNDKTCQRGFERQYKLWKGVLEFVQAPARAAGWFSLWY